MKSNGSIMSTRVFLSALIMALLFFLIIPLQSFSQHSTNLNTYNSHDLDKSVLFGNDVVINNEPLQDQKHVFISSSNNGWLFTAYTYFGLNNWPCITILKSTDNGLTWNVLTDFFQPFDNCEIRYLDLLVCGDSASDLKIVLAFSIVSIGSISGIGDGWVLRYDGESGNYEAELRHIPLVHSIALASDQMYPAINSNPHSIGCLYSDNHEGSGKDSVIFLSSSNGGISFNSRQSISGTEKYFPKVTLSYGRSLLGNTGRYFAAWEERTDFSVLVGHIYTAHSDPFFNSGFTDPVMIDSLVPGNYNSVRNPSIACQLNNTNNDSSDMTEVIVFEKMSSIPGEYEIHGVFNKKAGQSNHFTPFIPDATAGNKVSPCIIFNPFDSAFILTYFNATDKKLPLFHHDFNLHQPDNWTLITPGFNDDTTLTNPSPILGLNVGLKQEVVTWTKVGSNNNNVALFDALYLITGDDQISYPSNSFSVSAWPNPCAHNLNIAVTLEHSTELKITLYSILGTPVVLITDKELKKGIYFFNLSCDNIACGQFLLNIRTNSSVRNVCVIVNH